MPTTVSRPAFSSLPALLAFLAFAHVVRLSVPSAIGAETQGTSLFNGRDLAGWQVFVDKHDGPVADQKIFQVRDGAIPVYPDAEDGSAQPFAMLVTTAEYSDYRVSLEYRWGTKKFQPRAKPDMPRDAGLLYHVREPITIWPVSVECQIQTGDTGDIWVIKTQVTSTIHRNDLNYLDADSGGVETTRGLVPNEYNRFARRYCYEHEGWNRVEVVVRGDSATHIINGQTTNRALKMKFWDAAANQWQPLTRGRILLQAEGAEIFYRNIVLTPLE